MAKKILQIGRKRKRLTEHREKRVTEYTEETENTEKKMRKDLGVELGRSMKF